MEAPILPDGMSPSDLQDLGSFADLIRNNPQKAMIIADYQMKYQVKHTRSAWVQQANILYVVQETEIWRHHPENFSSFFEWCQQPEIDIPPSVVSDMVNIVRMAPTLKDKADVDIFAVIEEVGHSKVRQMVPLIKDAVQSNTVAETVPALVDELKSSSFRQIIKMVNPGGMRMKFDPEAVYSENADGTYNLMFRKLDFDQLDLLAQKVGLKRWFGSDGRRIEPPTNAFPKSDLDD